VRVVAEELVGAWLRNDAGKGWCIEPPSGRGEGSLGLVNASYFCGRPHLSPGGVQVDGMEEKETCEKKEVGNRVCETLENNANAMSNE